MGQKANLLTLRKNYRNINFSNLNKNVFFLGFNFLKSFKQLLLKKRILVLQECFNLDSGDLFVKTNLYFRALKVKAYRRKQLSNVKPEVTFNQILTRLLQASLKRNRVKQLYTQVSVLNRFSKTVYSLLIKKTKYFSGLLFKRRLGLYFDFIRVLILYTQNKANLDAVNFILSDILKFLQKKLHAKFLVFVKVIFNLLISEPRITSEISGAKLVLNGRLKGKARASSICVQAGAVSNQTLAGQVDFVKTHVFTKKLGTIGLKLWVQKKI